MRSLRITGLGSEVLVGKAATVETASEHLILSTSSSIFQLFFGIKIKEEAYEQGGFDI